MNAKNLFIKTSLLVLVQAFYLYAQVTDSTPSGRVNKTQEVQQAEVRINQIVSESERFFKQGEFNIKDGRLTQAWEDFDKSVEVILASGVNVVRNSKLNDYYLQLIERIYRVEMVAKKKLVQGKGTELKISPECIKSESKNETAIKTVEFLTQAVNLYKKGDNDEAVSKLRFVLANEPMSATAYLLLGKIHFRRGDIEQAVSSLKTALFWDNRLIEAHILLGKIYFERGDVLQAKNYSSSASAIDSDNDRVQALSRLVEGRASSEDRRAIEVDSTEIEKLSQELREEKVISVNNNSDVIFVAPFRGVYDYDLLSNDFAYVLSEVLTAPNLCVVRNEEREKILENFAFDTDETFTLATAIKFAIASKSNLLIIGKYVKTSNYINTIAKIVRVNEGRFLSEEFPDGRRITRDIILNDSPSNLRVLQGQIAYQILYQRDKAIPYSQNQFVETTSKIKIPASLNIGNGSDDKIDFSIKNSLKKTTCDEIVLKNLQLRNFRLGITFDEATKLLPKAKVKNVNLYEKEMYQSFSTATLKDLRFKEIHLIVLNFFDNRLYSTGVVYDDNIKWQNINEFTSQVEKSLNLPAMKRGGYKFDGKYLYCGNYQIKVMLANHKIPAIHLFDVTVFDKIIQRMKKKKIKF